MEGWPPELEADVVASPREWEYLRVLDVPALSSRNRWWARVWVTPDEIRVSPWGWRDRTHARQGSWVSGFRPVLRWAGVVGETAIDLGCVDGPVRSAFRVTRGMFDSPGAAPIDRAARALALCGWTAPCALVEAPVACRSVSRGRRGWVAVGPERILVELPRAPTLELRRSRVGAVGLEPAGRGRSRVVVRTVGGDEVPICLVWRPSVLADALVRFGWPQA